MKTIVLASRKGGVGKTTLAAHLAVAAELAGNGPCVVMDTDPQASLAAWWNARLHSETPQFSMVTLANLAEKLNFLGQSGFKYAFIDTPPAITLSISAVIAHADFVLIPSRPSPHDLRAIGQTVGMVIKANRPFAFAVTQAKANSRLTTQTMGSLSEHGIVSPVIVCDRVDFASSMIDGHTVCEIDPKGKSAAEIKELWKFVAMKVENKTNADNIGSQNNQKIAI